MDILLVEDDPGDVELARIALSEGTLQTSVRVAERLRTAVIMIDERAPDVILLDLGLPDAVGLDGLTEIARRMSLAPIREQAPIIVLSGQNDQRLALRALERGAQDYLVKGEYTDQLLQRAIRYAVERKRIERELVTAARYDSITGLVNRTHFLGLLDHALDRATRNSGEVHIMYLDLDHFKNVNDSLGHAAGDALLREVGERLRTTVRNSDVVARLGGDEFTIMVEEVEPGAHVHVADKIVNSMRRAFEIDGVEIVVSPSIGVASFPESALDASTLLQHADTAMYRAKSRGRNTVEFFTDDMNASVREAFDLEMALRSALRRGEFELYYQPIVDGVTRRLMSIEALVRWRRVAGETLVSPGVFLPVLEQTGMIREVGEWVLRTACLQCREWQKRFQSDLRIAVNVSPKQLSVGGFAGRVAQVLDASGLHPSYLELEITEEVLLEDSDLNLSTLSALRSTGVAVAIDDFGSGYSSLSYLTMFPFDTVKIDRSFVARLAVSRDDASIAAGILGIAHNLGRHTIAEGVETEEQLDFLKRHSCAALQGFLFSPPLSGLEFEELLGVLPADADGRLIWHHPGGLRGAAS